MLIFLKVHFSQGFLKPLVSLPKVTLCICKCFVKQPNSQWQFSRIHGYILHHSFQLHSLGLLKETPSCPVSLKFCLIITAEWLGLSITPQTCKNNKKNHPKSAKIDITGQHKTSETHSGNTDFILFMLNQCLKSLSLKNFVSFLMKNFLKFWRVRSTHRLCCFLKPRFPQH